MKLVYTPQALAELDAVLGHIESHSPRGGGRVKHRIRATLDLLLRYPLAGRSTSVAGLHRIVVTPYPYLVFYRPSEVEVVVIAIRHAARDPGSMPG